MENGGGESDHTDEIFATDDWDRRGGGDAEGEEGNDLGEIHGCFLES